MLNAMGSLDALIAKSRIHFYKPIQIAEILYRQRMGEKGLDLSDLKTYRNKSKSWRDEITGKIINSICTSSQKFQDNLFDDNAIPPSVLVELGEINTKNDGSVEAYIYKRFQEKHFQLAAALDYCIKASPGDFDLEYFVSMFNAQNGLKRSLDKIFEVVVYSLFETLTSHLGVAVEIKAEISDESLLDEYSDFIEKVIGLNSRLGASEKSFAHFYRAGVTNAADRGLDMYSNFGPIVQVKHINLDVEVAVGITDVVSSTDIVIVCKSADQLVIKNILNQLGWAARIRSVVTFEDIYDWYELALRGHHSNLTAVPLMELLEKEIREEFPAIGNSHFKDFMTDRGYIKNNNFSSLT